MSLPCAADLTASLSALGLHCLPMMGGGHEWLLIHRQSFDFMARGGGDGAIHEGEEEEEEEEPVRAIEMLVRRVGGRFTVKVWGRKHLSGVVQREEELVAICQKMFVDSSPCPGLILTSAVLSRLTGSRPPPPGSRREAQPVDRLVSLWCHRLVTKGVEEDGTGSQMCNSCREVFADMENGSTITRQGFRNVKQEIVDDVEEDPDYEPGKTELEGAVDGYEEEEEAFKEEEDWAVKAWNEGGDEDWLEAEASFVPERDKKHASKGRRGRGDGASEGEKRCHECRLCGKKYVYLGGLKKHLKVDHKGEEIDWDEDDEVQAAGGNANIAGAEVTIHKCPKCGKEYVYLASLKKHMKIDHKQDLDEKEGTPKVYIGNDGRQRVQKYFCEFCGKGFEVKSLYLEHRTTHTGEKLYYCAECGKGFGFVSAYNYHVRVHLREKGLEVDDDQNALYHYCEHCAKRFTCPRILRRHIKIKHLGVSTEVQCEQCGKKFKNKDRLLDHRNLVHRTDDRYQCKVCSKKFGSKNMLDRHAAVHGEPQFECRHCGKRVKKKESLENHERIHTGEAPFKCQSCNSAFRSRPALYLHRRSHHDKEHQQRRRIAKREEQPPAQQQPDADSAKPQGGKPPSPSPPPGEILRQGHQQQEVTKRNHHGHQGRDQPLPNLPSAPGPSTAPDPSTPNSFGPEQMAAAAAAAQFASSFGGFFFQQQQQQSHDQQRQQGKNMVGSVVDDDEPSDGEGHSRHNM